MSPISLIYQKGMSFPEYVFCGIIIIIKKVYMITRFTARGRRWAMAFQLQTLLTK